MSLNLITLLGRIGKDPEVRNLNSGSVVANFSLATTEYYKDKSGEKKEETQWHRCAAWGKTAEVVSEYVHKGDMLMVTGKLVYDTYEKDGTKHTTATIKVDKLSLIGGGKRADKPEQSQQVVNEDAENDMPF